MKKYSECEKIAKVKDQSQMIGEFLEWLDQNKMFVSKYGPKDYAYPIHLSHEQLLAKYFKIDLNKAEKERTSILTDLQKK